MGTTYAGIPRQIVTELARHAGCTAFVETGTYRGDTTRWAATEFEAVHTIEWSKDLFELHSDELKSIPCVTPHQGDSKDVLPEVVADLGAQRALYWLDGHWSGGITAGEGDECPVMNELACLRNRPQDVILIDDARFFLSAPPRPHHPAEWPTMSDIVRALPEQGRQQLIQVIDDVIFIVPNEPGLTEILIRYAQDRADQFGAGDTSTGPGPVSMRSRLGSVVRKIGGRS